MSETDHANALAERIINEETPTTIALIIGNLAQYLADFLE